MISTFQVISGSVVAPLGFRASGVFCGIKASEKGKPEPLDLAIIASDCVGPIAGMFTTNQICAAPVKLCLKNMKMRKGQAIVANSGNANACTSVRGKHDAKSMSEAVGKALGMDSSHVFVASTGRIGLPLPMSNIKCGIENAVKKLSSNHKSANEAAKAIMTSDTFEKEFAVSIDLPEANVRIGGIAKGSGMIHPLMTQNAKRAKGELHATMLAFLTSDICIESGLLQKALSEAVEDSFNSITIDGDRSTNDTVLLLANGKAKNPMIRNENTTNYHAFRDALSRVCLELSKKMVKDAEGASRFVKLIVDGARTNAEAKIAAQSVANSLLVKTSWSGGDPNWGRIVDALGYSSAKIVEEKIDIAYCADSSSDWVYSLRKGTPTEVPFERLCLEVARSDFDLHIHLHLGKGRACIYTCDLTEAYVSFNKGDISKPSSLGG